MTTVPYTIDDGESEPIEVELPAHWEICDRCSGEGKSSSHLGSFSANELLDDPNFAEDYMNGMYDTPCPHCEGSGKVKEIDRDRCTSEVQKRSLELMDDEAAYKRESFRERKHESLMLGESRLEDWDGVEP